MIEPNELRMGNYVRLITVGTNPKYPIGALDFARIMNKEITVEGIPLDEAWLKKLGFEYFSTPCPEEFNPFMNFNPGYDFYKKDNLTLQSHYRSFNDQTLALWVTEEHFIMYLHELQNYLHIMTGIELTFNP